jgi:hypothetical protein
MFTPRELDLERGWPGRVDGDRVVQLAAQTLQAFFTGGGSAREHAEYPLAEVVFRAPVLHPPSVRIFTREGDFRFANPAAVVGPEQAVRMPHGAERVVATARPTAVVGADGRIGGYTLLQEFEAPQLAGEKRRDFALALGPTVLTPDELELDLDALAELAGRNTRLVPGDLLATLGEPGPPLGAGEVAEADGPFGLLRSYVAAPS